MRVSRRLLALTLTATIALAACGGDDGEPAGGELGGSADGPVHVHGLGVNPSDGALFIATHTGLFRAGKGEQAAERVGTSSQDTMGFTVVGPDRFLGSGHPGEFDNAVNPLGLIRSTDAGKSWETVSLEGEADFHVLRSAHGRVYGVDATSGRFLVSADGGDSWEERALPGPAIDLAVDPHNPERLIAAVESGLHLSRDDGRTWRPVADRIGLLAWPARGSLYLVDAQGVVHVSGDAGARWSERGAIGGQPAALLGQGARVLYAALPDGTVKQSTDGGASWSVRSSS